MNLIELDNHRTKEFEDAVAAMAAFRRTFGRNLDPSFIAELYAAKELGLELRAGPNEPGFDAVDSDGYRYEIKHRSPTTLNIDVNSFEFDYLVLVELDDACLLAGVWRITETQARQLFVFREKYRKYQTTQVKVKRVAERLR